MSKLSFIVALLAACLVLYTKDSFILALLIGGATFFTGQYLYTNK